MSHRALAYGIALIAALAGAMSLPARGRAASGGGGLAPAPSGATSPSGQGPAVGSGNTVVTASGAGITVSSRVSALLRHGLRVSGVVDPSNAGSRIEVERLGRETHWSWAPTTSAQVAPDGSFSAIWRVNHIGRFRLRAVLLSSAQSHAAVASPTVTIIAYRPSLATIFGPGFYGSQTACGETLGHTTLGVANRTLPCGTPVALYYHGRTLVVPVIDRGPYANGADWDLTTATARRLGVSGTATIGAVSLPRGS